MNNAIYRVTLDIHKTNSQAVFSFKKNDTARTILFCLAEGGRAYKIAENCTAVFVAKKSDETVLFNECTISGNIVEYTLTNQTSAVSGRLDCELRLIGADGKQITSPQFTIIIENNVYDDSVIESTDEFTALQAAISAAANLDISVDGKTVTLTGKDGAEKVITLKDGVDGVSIVGVSVNTENHLIVSFSNGSTVDAGEIDVETAVDEKISGKLFDKQDKAITDEGGYYTSDTVEGALQETGEKLSKANRIYRIDGLTLGYFDGTQTPDEAALEYIKGVFTEMLADGNPFEVLGEIDGYTYQSQTHRDTRYFYVDFVYTDGNSYLTIKCRLTTKAITFEKQEYLNLSLLNDDADHRTVTDAEKASWNGKGTYSKPTSGIPSSDLDYSTFPVVTLTATLEDGTTKTYSLFGSEVTV